MESTLYHSGNSGYRLGNRVYRIQCRKHYTHSPYSCSYCSIIEDNQREKSPLKIEEISHLTDNVV